MKATASLLAAGLLGLLGCVQQRSQGEVGTPPPSGPDQGPPLVPGTVQFSSVRHTTLRVSWPGASDDLTAKEDLEYRLVKAARAEDLDSVEKAAAATGEAVVFEWRKGARSHTAAGLRDSARYAFAVLVRDEAGNRSLYSPQSVQMVDGSAPTPGTALSFHDLGATAETVAWGLAADGVTAQEALQYKVVWSPSATPLLEPVTADALPAAQVALDWTANAKIVRLEGIPDVLRTFVGVLVRDQAGHRALYPAALPLDLTVGRLLDLPLDGDGDDMSGVGPSATLTGTTPAEDRKGELDKAIAFNGTTSHADVGNGAFPVLGAAASFSLWVRPAAVPADGNYYELMTKARVFTVTLYGEGGRAWPRFGTGDGTVWGAGLRGVTEVPPAAWTHVVVTFAAGVVSFYVNGQPAGSGTAAHPSLAATNACPLTVGYKLETADPACTMLSPENYLNGALDDLRLFSRALSSTEIAALYHERAY